MLFRNHETYDKGLFAEKVAEFYLKLQFYTILESRFKTKFGEIDIIAKRGNVIIMVEVKYRENLDDFDSPVSDFQKRRIINSAKYFLSKYNDYQNFDIRFDVILIKDFFKITHIKSAWDEEI